MKKRNIMIAGITALTVLLASGAMVFAASDTTTGSGIQMGRGGGFTASLTDTQREAVRQARLDSMKNAISSLLSSGTITQDVADKLLEIQTKAPGEAPQGKRAGFCTNLTDEQQNALQQEMQATMNAAIAELVNAGTITQEQADQMTPGQRMMSSVNFTEDQRDAVMQARIDSMKTAAANLVKKGTLSQEEADSITAMPVKSTKPRGNGMMQSLTEEQRTALHDAAQANMEDQLASLVQNGTLTQEQADQLLTEKGGPGMGFGGKHRNGPMN